MFGLTHNLEDNSLYLLHDIIEKQLLEAEKLLLECSEDNAKVINAQIEYYKQTLSEFELTINKQLKEKFQFSVEELYSMYGQYESRFIGVEFHKFSVSGRKYPRDIGGTIQYSKSERENLEKIINSPNIPRTNGRVKFKVSSNYNLNSEQNEELLSIGFMSGDIHEITAFNIPVQKTFMQEGFKEIPNTINIEFDPTGFDPFKTALYLLTQRINNGGILIENEWDEYCGYSILYQTKFMNSDLFNKLAYELDGSIKKKVRFYELRGKLYNKLSSRNEILEYFTLLRNRSNERIEIIREVIKQSTNKSLETFKEEFPVIFNEIREKVSTFEDETLEYHETIIPIYWNFRSFLHIYLKHCEELQIVGHFQIKTKFQYTQKNIKRILGIAISELKNRINERLQSGKDFRIFGDHTFYYNGNYYAMRIEIDGRVDSFYPMESKPC